MFLMINEGLLMKITGWMCWGRKSWKKREEEEEEFWQFMGARAGDGAVGERVAPGCNARPPRPGVPVPVAAIGFT